MEIVVEPSEPGWEQRVEAWSEQAAREAFGAPSAESQEYAALLRFAALIQASASIAVRATAARARPIWQANTRRLADDPQIQESLGALQAEAALALAAVRGLETGLDDAGAGVPDADRASGTAGPGAHLRTDEARPAVAPLLAGTVAVSERMASGLFDTLGASSTQEELGLHRIWLAHQRWAGRLDLTGLRRAVAVEALDAAGAPPLG